MGNYSSKKSSIPTRNTGQHSPPSRRRSTETSRTSPPHQKIESDDQVSPVREARNNSVSDLLFAAIERGDLEVVEQCIAAGTDPSLNNNLALRLAAQHGHLPIVQRLLEFPQVNPAAQNNSALRLACENGHLHVATLLLTLPRVDPTAFNQSALREACQRGHVDVVNLLLSLPAVDATVMENYPLRVAALEGHVAVVDRLLQEPSVDPSARENHALVAAACNGHAPVVALLLNQPGIRVAHDNQAVLMSAAQHGHVAVVQQVLADPTVHSDPLARYALIAAANRNHVEVVHSLLSWPYPTPPLTANHLEHMNEIHKHSLAWDAFLEEDEGHPLSLEHRYALALAARNGFVECVRTLLSPTVNLCVDFSYVVQLAAKNEHLECVRLLLRVCGAETWRKVAERPDCQRVIGLLVEQVVADQSLAWSMYRSVEFPLCVIELVANYTWPDDTRQLLWQQAAHLDRLFKHLQSMDGFLLREERQQLVGQLRNEMRRLVVEMTKTRLDDEHISGSYFEVFDSMLDPYQDP
eukprot:TRINITY_DN4750_c0_g1_i1.p1 TRINITY_DN4750_c0_g1~~TRINITY_DN4750_c0_g1_i1.p1  ORF type:complete len:524 (+),score=97.90 TRINITY_DN4750_c0_g1_i1:139-1710(+)